MLHFSNDFVGDRLPLNMSMFTLILHFQRKFCKAFTLAHELSVKTKYPKPYLTKKDEKKHSVKNTAM